MESTRLLLTAAGKEIILPHDGCKDIETKEVQTLLQLARQTVWSLEMELSKRGSDEELRSDIRNDVEKMRRTLTRLNVLQRVDDAPGQMLTAAKIIQKDQSTRREKIYRQFLIDVRDQCSAGTALLCAKCMGKTRIVGMSHSARFSLLNYLKTSKPSFHHAVLEDYAVKLGIARRIASSTDTANMVQDADVERRIEYKYSEASLDALSMLGSALSDAVQASYQYKWERRTGGLTTDCIQGLTPKNRGDITLQLLLGFDEGTELMEKLEMQVIEKPHVPSPLVL